jgi:hypothetical protein
MLSTPDFVVIVCLRTVLSGAGLSLIIAGLWQIEKKWEVEGSAAFDQAADTEAAAGDYNPAPDGITTTTVPWEDLEVDKNLALIGFGLLALSFLVSGWGGYEFYLTPWSIASVLTVLLMGYMVLFPLQQSSQSRNLMLKQQTLLATFICGCFLAFAGQASDEIPIVTLAISALGIFLWIPSYWIMWRQRKLGKLWDLEGKPNYDVCYQNVGGHMLVYSLFLLWVGTSAVPVAEFHMTYIPFFLTARSLVVILTVALLLVPALLAIEYAFDKGSEAVEGSYGLDGITFTQMLGNKTQAEIIEGPTLIILSWLVLAVCCFMPFTGGLTIRRAAAAVFCIAIGLVYTLKLLPAFHAAQTEEFRKSFYIYCGLLVVLTLAVGINAAATHFLCAFGAGLILIGQGLSMYDRRRGEAWIYHKAVNPKPVMFSISQPFYMLGWILLSVALAVPM